MKTTIIITIIIIILAFALSIMTYNQLPDQTASHWNSQGDVDGYMPKFWGAFLMPIVLIGLLFMFIYIPKIDPLKANIKSFMKYYESFIIIISLFMLGIHVQTILWNIGIEINPGTTIPIGIGIIFYYAGVLCKNAKQNWFIGIRTPWTLSDKKVWEQTHKHGAILFKASGVLAIIGVAFGNYAMYFVLVPVLFTVCYTFIYSYLLYKRTKQVSSKRN